MQTESLNFVAQSNSGFVLARNDYTAYGEDIQSGTGLRTVAQGFASNLIPRQKYGLTERDEATGLDHTWFRKHEPRAGRWTSPDPYGGSMSISDPQSFNRYSYVTGQPTNFVDPSGLNAVSYFCYDIVTYGHWSNDPSSSVVHTERRCFTFGGGGGFPPGSGVNTGSNGSSAGPPAPGGKNCADFVNEVARILSAAPHQSVGRFVSQLYGRFGRQSSEFGSEGFKPEFQDDNQARHYIGGLYLASDIGATAALIAMNAREINYAWIGVGLFRALIIQPQTDSQRADTALNGVSSRHGGGLKDGSIKPYELSGLIQKEVCE